LGEYRVAWVAAIRCGDFSLADSGRSSVFISEFTRLERMNQRAIAIGQRELKERVLVDCDYTP
jgi:hypothetical protein